MADGCFGVLERYIRGPLGYKRLDKLQPLDIQKVYGEMQNARLSARAVRHTYSALHNALAQAVKWAYSFATRPVLLNCLKFRTSDYSANLFGACAGGQHRTY